MKKAVVFDGIGMQKFLQELSKNNNKVWFDENRERYTDIRKGFVRCVKKVHDHMVMLDPTLAHMSPEKSLFRINRDTRFSADKTPYKTHMGAKFSITGEKKGLAGYGFGVSAEKGIYVMGGVNKLEPQKLNMIRDALLEKNSKLLLGIKNNKFVQNFELSDLGFGVLKQVPRGYDKDSPHVDLLKLQAWWAMHWMTEDEVKALSDEDFFVQLVLEKLEMVIPLVSELNRALERI